MPIKSEYLITLLLSALVVYLMYLIMAPFFIPIFWAVVFVILFYPYYKWLLRRFKGRKWLASLVACASIAVFLIVPMALIGSAVANELFNLFQWAEEYVKTLSNKAHRSPSFFISYIEEFLSQYIDISGLDIRSFFANSVKQYAKYAGEGMTGFIKNIGGFAFHVTLAFFSMYFLFRDGDRLFAVVKDLVPLSEPDKKKIINKNRGVISATINGGLLVGAAQGLLGGIAFWFLGLSAPVLWGFVMFIFSFLPSFGTAIVWVPASIYLLIIGSYAKGIVLLLWGAFIIGLIDNFLRPIIVSGRTNLHPLLLFFSILGAVNAFGLIGIIAGPLILSISQAMIELYHEYIKSKNTWAG